MSERRSFTRWKSQLQAGDDRAAEELVNTFTPRLIALARHWLSRRMSAKVDPEDIVQSVYRSFFTRVRDANFDFEGWADLWALLAQITIRKCSNQVRHFSAARRNVRREVRARSGEGSDDALGAISRDPSPSEAAVLTELVDQLLNGFDGYEREIVQLTLQGYGAAEISGRLVRAERTVQRVRERARRRLQRIREAETA
jgi:RNA polymerase sigma-70 factor (ECF subfamily)